MTKRQRTESVQPKVADGAIDPAWVEETKVNVDGLPYCTLPILTMGPRMYQTVNKELQALPNKEGATIKFDEELVINPANIEFEEGNMFASIWLNRVTEGEPKPERLYIKMVEAKLRKDFKVKSVVDKFDRTKVDVPLLIMRGGAANDNLSELQLVVEDLFAAGYKGPFEVNPIIKPSTSKDPSESDLFTLMWCKWPQKEPMRVNVDGTEYLMTPEDFNKYCLDSWYDFVVEVGIWARKLNNGKCSVGWNLNLRHIAVRRVSKRNDAIDLQPVDA